MDFTKVENAKGQGWCATKLSSRGEKVSMIIINACPDKIEGWGMCNKACSPQNQAFAYANMNLLTDDECKALTKWVGKRGYQKVMLSTKSSLFFFFIRRGLFT